MTKNLRIVVLFVGLLAGLLGAGLIGAWNGGGADFALAQSAPLCISPTLRLSPDYTYVLGSAGFNGVGESTSTYRWLVNGTPSASAPVGEGLLLRFDGSVSGANGELPTLATAPAYAAGRWGSALALTTTGRLRYARAGNLSLDAGTIEMWVALRLDGDDSAYTQTDQTLFLYRTADGDSLGIRQSKTNGTLYAGGSTGGAWQSAYSSKASMRGWKAGEWHHLAFTYSDADEFMRFYVDGALAADTNEHRYNAPAATADTFAVGGDVWSANALYFLDEVRFSDYPADGAEIAARAHRLEPLRANELWRPTAALTPGSTVVFEFTPSTLTETGAACQSAPLVYPGIPVTDPQPPSTLLPPNSTSMTLTVHSSSNTTCAYALSIVDYAAMTPFDAGAGTLTHTTQIHGLNPDCNTLNDVYVRCAAHPDYLMRLQYRALSEANPRFPRTGNLWGWWQFGPEYDVARMSRIDLWLGVSVAPDKIREMRSFNPDILVLTSINAVENNDIPTPDYYLRDVNGELIEVWPGSYRLNLTKPEVAEYQARYAYQTLLDSGLMADGVFFDNVMTTQSWQNHDIYGNPVAIDADEDGVADDPAVLDAAWKAGVFHEIETFRQMAPYAHVNGHSLNIFEPGIAELFNGVSYGFQTANVLEGESSFASLWEKYHAWYTDARPPVSVMFESSPQDQIAYGYDYSPKSKIPTSTLEFARTYYPYVRFGLALTLMNDGYFAHEFGDTWHGNDWWYDELDYDLGYPLGPASRVETGFEIGPNLILNPGFESEFGETWRFWVNTGEGCAASISRDTTTFVGGAASARAVVTATSDSDWHINFYQRDRPLEAGSVYDFSFWAKADRPRLLGVSAQKGVPDWRGYGLGADVEIGTTWQLYTRTFQATETVTDARLQFFVGEVTGTVWIDDVSLRLHPPDVYRRDYTTGAVLLNGTSAPQTVAPGEAYWRLLGDEAARDEFILDDAGDAFTTTLGTWADTVHDSGEWKATGPFYHAWNTQMHVLQAGPGEARWSLPLAAADVYTITAWWPAAPTTAAWMQPARYEVVSGGQVVVSTTLDQSQAGDEWHFVAAVALDPAGDPYLRVVCAGPCVADALHLRSAARYNDGSPATEVTLAPLDGIILRRVAAAKVYLPLVLRGQ